MAIEISVLGDIETRIGGQAIDLGHVRRQTVFIGLLVDANQLVSVDRLIDRVWGEDPPAGARSSLYSYVSRLRSALSAAEDEVLVDRRPGGYKLSLSHDAVRMVDLYRFRELTALPRGSSESATLSVLEEALHLWRADAFGALDSPWVNELRETLRLERFGVELDRNDLLLHQGRQAERLGELIALVQSHPLDERLLGQLMLALYREGRTAQALEHYDRMRRALSDEMGTDTGPELRDLHVKILNADPSLDAPHPPVVVSPAQPVAEVAPPVPLPSQLPSRPPLLLGREKERALLDTMHESHAQPIAVVRGLGGVGKTSLALHWAHDNLARFPDGQLYVNLHGFSPSTSATRPETAVHDFLVALGMDEKAIPTSVEAQIGLYRSLLANKRVLILLDNARDAEQVRPLIPGSSSCLVVVTSRDRLSGLVATMGAHTMTVLPLTFVEARGLLAARVGEHRVAAEPEAVESIIAGCGRLPLALAIAATHATSSPHLPLSELAARLRESDTRLDALDTGELNTSLRSVLDASHRALPEDAGRLLGLISLVPGQHVGLHATAALAGLTPARTSSLLRILESAHLVHQVTPGRYEVHDLVRLHAREQAELEIREEERCAALRSFIDFYVHTAAAGNLLLGPQEPTSSVARKDE